MLGLFAMLLGCAALTAVASYWSFWEMEHRETRSKFAAKLSSDLVGLFGRNRSSAARTRENQTVAT